MTAPNSPPNPYIGPRSFRSGETLYGRDREVEKLLDLLIAERIVLLYSPSGAGKSSLVQAALIPRLEEEGFRVRPVMRVSQESPSQNGRGRHVNRYIFSVLLSLEEALPEELQVPLDVLALLDLPTYLRRTAEADGERSGEVLIFDQFEEILTVDPADQEAKAAFFAQVGQALRDRNRWALFAMREDYIAGLDPFLRPVPTRLGNTFRLDLLEEAAARSAMQQPARQAGVDFTDDAAKKLANDLRKVRVQRPDGSTEEQLGLYVEPVQLQVVCYRLWEKLPADARQIVEADVTAVGNVDSALSDYYAERVASAARETGVKERAIREWCERQLITGQGIRGQVLQGPEQGLDRAAIQRLLDAYLVRAEKRRGATWYELAHDRLIEPVQTNNAAWREAHLSALQRQADLWEQQNRPDGLLLRDQALTDAERWAEANADELTAVEQDFLATCRKTRVAAQRERRNNRLIRGLAVAALIGLVLAIVGAVLASGAASRAETARAEAVQQRTAAEAARTEAEQQKEAAEAAEAEARRQGQIVFNTQLAARSVALLTERYDVALLLGVEAARRAEEGGDSFNAQNTLLSALTQNPRLVTHLRNGVGEVASVAANPNAAIVASGSYDGQITLWDLSSRQPLGEPLAGHEGAIWAMAFSPDGSALASGSTDGSIILWDVANRQPLGEPLAASVELSASDICSLPSTDSSIPTAITFVNSSGRAVDVYWIDYDGVEQFWFEMQTGETIRQDTFATHPWCVKDQASGEVLSAVVATPDEMTLTITGVEDQVTGVPFQVTSLAFSPDGRTLAAGSDARRIILWDVVSREQQGGPLARHTGSVWSVAFSPDGSALASGGEDGLAILWDVASREIRNVLFNQLNSGPVRSVAFSPDGERLALGSGDGSVSLWDVATGEPLGEPAFGHTGGVWGLAFSPDGSRLASASADTSVILWDVVSGLQPVEPLVGHTDVVWGVTFNPDGSLLASGSADGTVILWDLARSQRLGESLGRHAGSVRGVFLSPDGSTLASGSTDGNIILWDVANRQPLGEPLAASVELSASDICSLPSTDSSIATAITFVNSSGRAVDVYWIDFQGIPQLWFEMQPGETARQDTFATHPWCVRDHESKEVLSAVVATPDEMTVTITGVEDQVTGVPFQVTSLALTPDGRTLASGGADGSIILWDVASRERQGGPLAGHTGSVWSVVFSPDGSTLASGGEDGLIILWDAASGQQQGDPLAEHFGAVWSLAFSLDGGVMASGSGDGSIILWDVKTHQAVATLREHRREVNRVAFAPNGAILASGGSDGSIILWDMASLQASPLIARGSPVWGLAFSPDGRMLASGHFDGSLNLWDVEMRRRLDKPLAGEHGPVWDVAFSPDGAVLISGHDDGSIVLWDVDLASWSIRACDIAARNFNQAEWTEFFGGRQEAQEQSYHKTCEQWPEGE